MAIPRLVHPDDVKAMLAIIGIDPEEDHVKRVAITPGEMLITHDISPDETTTRLVFITPAAEKRS